MRHTNQNWTRLGKNLSTLIVIATIAIFFYVYTPKSNNPYPISQDTSTYIIEEQTIEYTIDTIINPNTATLDDFLRIGLNAKQAQSCINYRQKGGRFKQKQDMKKIFTITDTDYARIEPYITIPVEKPQRHSSENHPKKEILKTTPTTVNINTCDTTELKQLPKIGSFRARKIVEQRDRLGGFHTIEQLRTIYSMDDDIINEIKPYIIIDTADIQKININTATFKEINSHPLISYEQTKKILQYKKIMNTISTPEELLSNNILDKDEFEKIKFYIKTF